MPGKGHKRAGKEGTVFKTPSGVWRGQVMDGYRDNGKRNILNFSAQTRSEVLDQIRRYWVEKEAANGSLIHADSIRNFGEYADHWYASYKSQVAPSTYSTYRYTLVFLKTRFGTFPLNEIKTSDINRFISDLAQQGYSQSQISKCHAMLVQIFDMAESDDLVSKNYARLSFRSVKSLVEEESRKKKEAFTVDEFHTLLAKLPENLIGYSIRLMLVTGLRLQELIALTPNDLAADGSWVRVNKAVKMVDGHPILGTPKSHTSNRLIPIAPVYRSIAVWLRQNGGQVYLWCSTKRENLLYDTGSVRRRYYRALTAIPGVRPLSPHCCRHTYVTLLQREHVPMETIARLLGHSEINTTNHYLHISADSLQDAVLALEDV